MAATAPLDQPDTPASPVFENDTLTKIFFNGIDRMKGPAAMQYKVRDQWKSLPHAEVEERVTRLAAALDGLGVRPGDRVGILSENRPEWAISDYAVLGLGAISVPIYTTLPPTQTAYILNDSGAKVLFVSNAEHLKKLAEIRSELTSLENVVVFDSQAGQADALELSDLLETGARRISAEEFAGFRERAMAIDPQDIATLIYTSGTTGRPKGVMLTHSNIASNVEAVRRHDVLNVGRGDVALSFLPLSHSFERMVDYFYWNAGATIAYVDAVDKVGPSMVETRPHIVCAAPRVFEKIYARVMSGGGVKKALVLWAKKVGEAAVPDRISGRASGPRGLKEKLADKLVFSKLRARTGDRIRLFVSGSAPLSPDIARFFWAAGLPVLEGYGLTETSPVLTVNRPGAVKLGTVGQPIPWTELRIGESGEILARGPQIMKGYWNAPEATAEVIDSEGWFHTGDIGEIDPQGYLSITDRLKNLLVTAGGKNIAPQPIENQVAMSPYISQVVMLGDRRAFPILLVVPDFDNLRSWARERSILESDPEHLVLDPKVREFLSGEALSRLHGLARFEMPKKVGIVPREFSIEAGELTPSLKIKRKAVEEHYREMIEEMYAVESG